MEDSYVLQLLKPKFKDFHLCFCGFAECEPLHSYGPAARLSMHAPWEVTSKADIYEAKKAYKAFLLEA